MNGYTPFGGIKENESASVGCPGVGDEAVRKDSYCFKVGNKPQAAAVPSLDVLPKEIAELFTRAFIQGKIDPKQRPSALEWHTALEQFESKLKICNKNITHLYLEDLVACPWCEADNRYMASITKPLIQKHFTTPVMASNSYSIGSYYTGGNLSTGNIHNSPNFNTSNRTNSQNLKNVFGFLSTLKSKLDKKWLIGIGIIVVLLVLFFIGTQGSSFLDTKGNMQEETEMYDFLYVSSPKNNVFVVPSIVPQFASSDTVSHDLSETELPKSEVDISDFTEFADCLEYEQQTKDYTFTVPTDGTYRFEIMKMLNEIMVEFRILDAQKTVVEANAYCESGEGITLKNTKAGEVYEIQVKQKKGLGEYVLQLGKQKEVVDVSDFTKVTDSLEFKEQNNRYSFTPCNDGVYRFELSGMPDGTSVELYILNAFQEVVQSEPYCLNGEGVTVEHMKAGETYEIQVRQHIGFSGYQISIGHQKDTVAITNHLLVADKITYTNQRNAYAFQASMPGTATFTIVGMEQGMAVSVYVLNEMGETVASEPYCQNAEKIEVQDVFVGEEYQVFVKQRNGVGTYQLIID